MKLEWDTTDEFFRIQERPVHEQVMLLSSLLTTYFSTEKSNGSITNELMNALSNVAFEVTNEVGIRLLKSWDQTVNQHKLSLVKKGFARNPHLPPDIIDWLIDCQVGEMFEEYTPQWNFEKSPVQHAITTEQIERAIDTYPVNKIIKFVLHEKRTELNKISDEVILRFAHRWADSHIENLDTIKLNGKSLTINDEDAFNLFMRWSKVDGELVAKMWKCFEGKRLELLAHHKLPQEVIDEFCQMMMDPDFGKASWEVEAKKAILENARIDEAYLYLFYDDRDNWPLLAKNPNLPADIVKFIAREGTAEILISLLENENIDPVYWNELFEQTIQMTPNLPFANIVRMPQLNSENIVKLWNYDLSPNQDRCFQYYIHPSVSAELRSRIVGYVGGKDYGLDVFKSILEWSLINNKPLSVEDVSDIARRVAGSSAKANLVRRHLVSQRFLPDKFLKNFAALKGDIADIARKVLEKDRGITA